MAQQYATYGQPPPGGQQGYGAPPQQGAYQQQGSYGGYGNTAPPAAPAGGAAYAGYAAYGQGNTATSAPAAPAQTGYGAPPTGGYQQPQSYGAPPPTTGYGAPPSTQQSYGGYNQTSIQAPAATQGGYGQNSYNQQQGGGSGGGYNRSGGSSYDNQSGGGGGGYGSRDGGDRGGDRGSFRGRGGGGSGGGQPIMGGNNTLKDGMIIQEDTIFVAGLPTSAGPTEIAEFFGKIGIIKTDKRTREPKIWIYKDQRGGSKGECTITYEDCEASQAAVNWFNDKDFEGKTIKVSIAQRKVKEGGYAAGGGRGRGRGRGGFGGGRGGGRGGFDRGGRGGGSGGGGQQRDGDWNCSKCQNSNFARRSECNRCGEPRSDGGGGGGDRDRDHDRGGDRRGGGGYDRRDRDRDRGGDRSDRRSRPY